MGDQQINEWQNIKKKGMFLFILSNWIYFFYAVIETIGILLFIYLLCILFGDITINWLLFGIFFFSISIVGKFVKIVIKWKRLKKN